MRSILIPLALLLLLCAAAIACAAALARAEVAPAPAAAPPVARAVRASDPIVVDGVLDEAVWSSGNAITALTQAEPSQGSAPSQRTEVRIAYDDDAIYVGARMYDSRPDSIVARLSRRDNDTGSDYVAVDFDTFRDRRTGYYFAVSAAGTLLDGTYMNDDWDDSSWDGVWNAHVHRDGQGWTAEMRIPFSQMRGANGDRRIWGVNVDRFIGRRLETDKLVYTPRGQSGFVSRFVDLGGLDDIRSAHRIEITPYTTGKAEYLVHGPGDPFHTGSRYTPTLGGDLRTSVGPKFTLNASVNPDFGQVEIDPAVVNLSDAETYFDEKRPFFTEGLSVFRCGNNGASDYWGFNWPEPTFFYTRRIGRTPEGGVPGAARFADQPIATRILGAAKLTGQPTPALNIGLLSAVTQRERADFELGNGARGSAVVEPLTSYNVLRGLRSFNHERQGLGVMALETARSLGGTGLEDALNRNGLVTAMDGWTALDRKKTWVLSGYATASRVDGTPARITALESDPRHYYQRPGRSDLGVDHDATSLTGYGGRVWLNRQTGPWMSNSAIGMLSPGFEANDLGYGSRADIVNGHAGLGYSWNKPNRWRKYVWVIGAVAQSWNMGGQHTQDMLFVKSNLEQMNAWSWTLTGSLNRETIADRATRGGPTMLNPPSQWGELYWDTNGKSKLFLSSDLNVTADVMGSHDWTWQPGVTWKPSSNVSFSAGPTLDWNREDAHFITSSPDPLATATAGGRYVFALLDQRTAGAQVRMDCSLTPALSLQLFVQPLVSSGRYANYRELARPGSYDFLAYGSGGSTLDLEHGSADPDGSGPAAAIDIGHRDFTYRTVRGNAVLRWEYVPGSTFYLVWTQDRTGFDPGGDFHLGPSLSELGRTPANNIVMVKVAHHFEI
jgi:hypothetical protein